VTRRLFLLAMPAVVFALTASDTMAAPLPVYGYKVLHRYPHDPNAFTEGLFYGEGYLYESTGEFGSSSVRKTELETGKVVQQTALPPTYFGEGIVAWEQRLIQVTWRQGVGVVYDKASLTPTSRFSYTGEGWGMTRDAVHLYLSDGTPDLRILDPATLATVGTIHVTANGVPVANLNELEWIKGEIYANVWMTDRIARIDPSTGHVLSWIDLTGLHDGKRRADGNDVLNGIAYDAKRDRLFVTGKLWPKLFEIRLTHKAPAP
jgi:glutaminyl-peptide cyclotransferase